MINVVFHRIIFWQIVQIAVLHFDQIALSSMSDRNHGFFKRKNFTEEHNQEMSQQLHRFLKDLGYGSTYSSNVIFTVFEHLSIYPGNARETLTAPEISKCLAMMAMNHQGLYVNPTLFTILGQVLDDEHKEMVLRMKTWNLELFFTLVCKMNSTLDWSNVLLQLDSPDLVFFDSVSVAVILQASKAVLGDLSFFPTQIFLNRWSNRKAQIQFLTQAVQIAPEIFYNKSIQRVVVGPENFTVNNTTTYFMNSCASNCWNCLELIQICIEYTSTATNVGESMAQLLEMGLEQAPDLLLLAFAQVFNFNQGPWGALVKDLAPKLVISMITGHVNCPIVLPRVWELNPSLIMSGFLLMYLSDNTSLSRILDVAQDFKGLPQILDSKPFTFTIDLAALASRREYLNLEKWMQDRIRKDGEPFIAATLEFLNEKVGVLTGQRPDTKKTVPLSADVAMLFVRILRVNSGYFKVDKFHVTGNVRILRKNNRSMQSNIA